MTNTVRMLTAVFLLISAAPAASHPAALNLPLWQMPPKKQPAGALTRFSRLAGMFMGTVPCMSFRRMSVRVHLEIR